jgi:hypothetical protein
VARHGRGGATYGFGILGGLLVIRAVIELIG